KISKAEAPFFHGYEFTAIHFFFLFAMFLSEVLFISFFFFRRFAERLADFNADRADEHHVY
ncbi:MAG: hypothetical protein AAFP02_05805, partial [Bacteroidota bacterium]